MKRLYISLLSCGTFAALLPKARSMVIVVGRIFECRFTIFTYFRFACVVIHRTIDFALSQSTVFRTEIHKHQIYAFNVGRHSRRQVIFVAPIFTFTVYSALYFSLFYLIWNLCLRTNHYYICISLPLSRKSLQLDRFVSTYRSLSLFRPSSLTHAADQRQSI